MTPDECVFFDVETYFDRTYGLTRLSEVQYLLDPRFELLSVAAAADGKVSCWRGDDLAWLEQFRRWAAEGRRFVAHHARFDLRVLQLRHQFRPTRLGDTLLVAKYFSFAKHDLESLARQLLGAGKQGEPPIGRHLKDLTPAEWAALARYNAADVVLCRRLWLTLAPQLPPGELELIEQTLALQLRPRRIDPAAARDLASRYRAEAEWLLARHPNLRPLATRPVSLRDYLRKTFHADVPTVDKKKVGDIDRFGPEAAAYLRDLWRYKEVKKADRDVSTLSTRMGVDEDRVLVDLNYCGAHSHRWTSGGEGSAPSFNYQNLSRGAGVRELNVPSPGHVFMIGDLSQIEARITAWLADEADQLTAFAEGRDLYLAFAEPLFGRSLATADKAERQVGKAAVLGLGFLMGARRFAETLRGTAPAALALLSRQFHASDPVEAARPVVDTYRRQYGRIYRNGRAMFDAVVETVTHAGGEVRSVGRWIQMERVEDHLVVRLPTGGFLTYREVKLTQEQSEFGPRLLPHYQGGKISFSMPIENAVQSIARDLFARALLDLEKAGFVIAFHVHDEVIVEVPTSEAAARLRQFQSILGAADPRCPGLPIACEAFLSDRYTKDEAYLRKYTSAWLHPGGTAHAA